MKSITKRIVGAVAASGGLLALTRAMAIELAPQVVFLDIGMPGMSGYDVARAKALLDIYGYVDRNGDGWTNVTVNGAGSSFISNFVEQCKADVKKGLDVNEAQGDGTTALHWAAIKGDAAGAAELVRLRREGSLRAINLKTAAMLGIEVPQDLRVQANWTN